MRRNRLLTVLGIEGQIARDYQGADVIFRDEGWELED